MTEPVSNLDLERLAKIGIVFVPFITGTAAALGIIFDAGWFVAVGTGYYSLFSLSEHTVFALQAFPLGLLTIVTAFFGVVHYKRNVTLSPFALLLGFLVLLAVGRLIYDGQYSAAVSLIVGCLWIAIIVTMASELGVLYRMLAVFLALCIFAFGLGYTISLREFTRLPTHEITIQGQTTVKGTFLKGGAVGVIYLDEKRRPVFRKWDTIVSMASIAK